jgi:hypothetical protein
MVKTTETECVLTESELTAAIVAGHAKADADSALRRADGVCVCWMGLSIRWICWRRGFRGSGRFEIWNLRFGI